MVRFIYGAMILVVATHATFAQNSGGTSQRGSIVSNIPSDVVKDLAPTGTLRAGINLGNMVLAQKDEMTGEPKGPLRRGRQDFRGAQGRNAGYRLSGNRAGAGR